MRKPIIFVISLIGCCIVAILSATPGSSRSATEETTGILFGFAMQNRLYCELPRLPHDQQQKLHTLWPETARQLARGDHFRPFPFGSLPAGAQDLPGDTMRLVWLGGSSRVLIEDIGAYSDGCMGGPMAIMRLVDSLPRFPAWRDTYALFGLSTQIGRIEPFCGYGTNDEDGVLARIKSEVRQEIETAHIAAEISVPLDTIRYKFYARSATGTPDTVFMTAHGSGFSTESCWHTAVLLTGGSGHWKRQTVIDLHRGSFSFRFMCSLDLDNDGIIEFLISTTYGTAIYRLINGKLELIASGWYWGC